MTPELPPMAPLPNVNPSGSTNGTALGGAVAVVVIWLLGQRGIFIPAGGEAAIAVIVATLAGYLPASGRRA